MSLISFDEAYERVMNHCQDYGNEIVSLKNANNRILAEDIKADRDFPPFNRTTKDGITINYEAISKGISSFYIQGVIAAGNPTFNIENTSNCIEIMTGAVVPENADTVVMYEHITIENGVAKINKPVTKGQNIHIKGSDEKEGTLVIKKNTRIGSAEIGVLASVGKAEVLVKKLPKITIISTGNELVEVNETPLPHQIRKSNVHTLYSELLSVGITANTLHLVDEKQEVTKAISEALKQNDVLLLSGGVSKGKFDFIPDALDNLGVEKIFHRVLQSPGKPFWFGIHKELKTVVFSFPGNPASTFANYHIYFKDWLNKTLNTNVEEIKVILKDEISVNGDLTRFIRAHAQLENNTLVANLVTENGSGDLTSLTKCNGFLKLPPKNGTYKKGDKVSFVATKRIL